MQTLDATEPSAECKLGEGREAELFDLGDGRVLRLYRNTIAAGGPAEADFARSQLILSLGEPPPGSPPHLKALALVGRNLLLAAYRRAYRRSHPVNEDIMRGWHLPLAVSRLAARIEEEGTRLTRHIDRLIAEGGVRASRY